MPAGSAQTGIAGATHGKYGHLGGDACPGPGPRQLPTMSRSRPVELKVNFANLQPRIIQGLNYGNRLPRRWVTSFIGGYAGSPEGALLLDVATDLLIPTLLARRLLQLLCLRCARLWQLRAGRSVGQQRVDPGRQPEHTLHA